jgi:Protein of unknown function (DUF3761)
MFFRATLIAAAVATATVGWASPTNAQSPIAAAIAAPTSPGISGDDQCGMATSGVRLLARAYRSRHGHRRRLRGATYQCVDGTYSFSKTSKGACSRHGGIDHPV